MLTGLIHQVHKVKFLLNDHSTTILTGVGVGGTVATAVLTGRASFKAAAIIAEEKKDINIHVDEPQDPIYISKMDQVKLTWRYYLPPVATGVTTIACIVVANKISSKKIAALAVAGGISERALQEYKDKVVEKLGERKHRDIRDEIAQDRVAGTPINSQVVLVGSGKVLCFDLPTGRYFEGSVEDIKRAENKINYELLNHGYASLAEFHDELGIPPTSYTDSVGWNGAEPINVSISTVMSPDNRPCIAIDFNPLPHLEYATFHR